MTRRRKKTICVVIPAYGPDSSYERAVESCKRQSSKYDVVSYVVFNDKRSSQPVDGIWDTYKVARKPGYETGALDVAYKRKHADYYLLLHDSAELKPGAIDLFMEHMSRKMINSEGLLVPTEAVAWLTFPFFWDNGAQEQWGREQVGPEVTSDEGIFGSILMISNRALITMYEEDLFPRIPENKIHSQGTERLWPLCLNKAGIPWHAIHPFEWSNERITSDGYKAIRKYFAGRQ